jgi:hypothetical protein
VKRGRHAAEDGSFGKSAGAAALRGALLIAVAVALGLVLLAATDSPDPFTADPGPRQTTTTTTEPDDTTTTTTTPPRDPAMVRVLVANGSGVQGAAGRVQGQLAERNYNVLAAVNARMSNLDATTVYFSEGSESEAAALAAGFEPAAAVEPMPEERPVTDDREVDVIVVVGRDLAG